MRPTPPAAPAHPLAHPDGSPVRVLVVDDEPDLAEVVSGALRYEGWQATRPARSRRRRRGGRTRSCWT
jgi:hypothetical protein